MLKIRNFGAKTRINLVNMCRNSSTTVYALSSGLGKCGVAVIRVSGAQAGHALKELSNFKNLPQPRTAVLRSIKHPVSKEVLDKGLILWFPGPHSFTGEDSCEFHVHGGVAIVRAVLDALGSLPKMRPADPGEFTRKAFLNGKLDLTEVEGLADLLQAETEAQRKQAFLQTNGSLSKLYKSWRQLLLQSVAHIEAHIDFEETDTLEYGLLISVIKNIEFLLKEMRNHLADGRKGETLRTGVKTVILGAPNVGKSSLLNLLCQRPASIVTPISGTTRDVIEVTLNICGYPLVLSDTAGLRSNSIDVVEIEGMSRALQSYKNADLVILVIDFFKYFSWIKANRSDGTLIQFIKEYVTELGVSDFTHSQNSIVVLNKTDLDTEHISENLNGIVKLSCKNEDGLTALVDTLGHKLKELCGEPSQEHPSMNQVRHREQVKSCVHHLEKCLNEALKKEACDLVIMAERLRRALRSLGKLIGTVTSDEILDVIFKDFCIGK